MRAPFVAAVVATMLSAATVVEAAPVSPSFSKVMIVVLENTGYDEATRQGFLSSLAARGALLTNLTAEAHPSQPNYLALISGSTFGMKSDRNVDLDGSHVGDLLEAKGLRWKVYAQGFPGNCFLGTRSGAYVRKHVPFLSFKNVQADRQRCARIVDAAQLSTDIQNDTLPSFSLYIPDLKNDGHDSGAAFADHWLAKTFGPLLKDPQFMKDMLLVVTFDEDEHFAFVPSSNRVFTALIGDMVLPGSISNASYSHYSILRTVENGFGLGSLGGQDLLAPPIAGIWRY